MTPTTTREQGFDAARLVMVLAVAMLHALPMPYRPGAPVWAVVVACICRGAVPFFFILGGYFLKPDRLSARQALIGPFVRLLPLYLAWFFIYALVNWWRVSAIHLNLHDLLTGGAGLHLWFIPALAMGLCLVGAGIRFVGFPGTFGVCILLAIGSLIFGSYHEVLGLRELPAQRLLAAPLFVAIGAGFAKTHFLPKPQICALLGAAALAALLLEEKFISGVSGQTMISHDIVIATFVYGFSLFLIVRSIRFGSAIEPVAKVGNLALGIYASHLLFVWLVAARLGHDTLQNCLAVGVMAFLMALVLSFLLSRISQLQWLVSRQRTRP